MLNKLFWLKFAVFCALCACGDPLRADDEPFPGRTLEELKKFDWREFDTPNTRMIARVQEAKVMYAREAAPIPLEWSFRLERAEIAVGEPLIGVTTVRNPSERHAWQFSPPARGFCAGNLQVWYRKAGEEKFLPLYRWQHPCGIPVQLRPGETRHWQSQLNSYAAVDPLHERRLPIHEFRWLGSVILNTPGKYEIVARYINPDSKRGVWPVTGKQRSKDRATYARGDRDNVLFVERDTVKVFGPYPVTVVAHRDAEVQKLANHAVRAWEAEVPRSGCVQHIASPKDVQPLMDLSDERLNALGGLGDNIRLWRLARSWPLNQKKAEDRAKDAEWFERELHKAARLPAGSPQRLAVEVIQAAYALEKGETKLALQQMAQAGDPDMSLFVSWQLLLKEQQREAQLADTIDHFVKELGHAEFVNREAAGRALEAIGAPALDALRRAAKGEDAEVRTRAERLIRTIENRDER